MTNRYIRFVRALLTLGAVAVCAALPAQSAWSILSIPPELIEGADAVVRQEAMEYTRTSLSDLQLKVTRTVTVFNKAGFNKLPIYVSYDRQRKIGEYKGEFYDAMGNAIKKFKKKDAKDEPFYADFTFYSDNRVLYYDLAPTTYPYTYTFTYTINFNGFLGLTPWRPMAAPKIAVQESALITTCPSGLPLRYQERHLPPNVQKGTSSTGEAVTEKWMVANLPAVLPEPEAVYAFPQVNMAPGKFRYDGFDGDMSDWKSYGTWVQNMLQGQNELSPETIAGMQSLVADAPDTRQKVKRIYEYMQGRTRYVNIALGIGGFQPMPASEVDELGYGDCKALSNYTRALLAAVDIPAYYTEIGTADYQREWATDFASAQQTNHVILCVPNQQDTIWLECTSQSLPYDYLGRSSANRKALLVTEQGGVVVPTQSMDGADNHIETQAEFKVSTDGRISGQVHTLYQGFPLIRPYSLDRLSGRRQKEAFLEYMAPDKQVIELTGLQVDAMPEQPHRMSISWEGQVDRFVSKAGNRLFMSPNWLHVAPQPETSSTPRQQAFRIEEDRLLTDSLVYTLPSGYELEYAPDPVELTSEFGTYRYSINQEGSAIIAKRERMQYEGTYAAEKWVDWVEFCAAMAKADQEKIILWQKP